MWKIPKENVDKFGEESVSHIELYNNTYIVVRECDDKILAIGKELKGYIGDIIRTMYTGYFNGDGEYILTSDRHGMICKFNNNHCKRINW